MVRAGAVVVVGIVLALASPAVASAANPAPEVVPAVRGWTGGLGVFELRSGARIVVESGALGGEAEMLREDLQAVAGLDLRVLHGARARDGDVVLARDDRPGREGYRLVIGDRVTIAGDDAGVFYGTQTVLQILRARGTLPRGEARDWPRFRERGYMLDAGRKYWSPDYVVQTIREMAYLKLNTLQLHLVRQQRVPAGQRPVPVPGGTGGLHEGGHPPVRGGRPQVPRDDHPRDRDARARGSDPRGPARPRPRLSGLRDHAGCDQA